MSVVNFDTGASSPVPHAGTSHNAAHFEPTAFRHGRERRCRRIWSPLSRLGSQTTAAAEHDALLIYLILERGELR